MNLAFIILLLFGCGPDNNKTEVSAKKTKAHINMENAELFYSINPFQIDKSKKRTTDSDSYIGFIKTDTTLQWIPIITGDTLDVIELKLNKHNQYSFEKVIDGEAIITSITNYFLSDKLIVQKRTLTNPYTNEKTNSEVIHFRPEGIQKYDLFQDKNVVLNESKLLDTNYLNNNSLKISKINIKIENGFVELNSDNVSKDEFGDYSATQKIDITDFGLNADNISKPEDVIFWLFLVLDI